MAMRGITIAVLLMSVPVWIGFLSGVGFLGEIGTNPGPQLDTQQEEVAGEVGGNFSLTNIGGDASFFGVNIGTTNVLTVIFQLITNTSAALQAILLMPKSLADGIQLMARFFAGLMLLQFARGVLAE